MEFCPRSDVGETVPGPRACPGLDWDGNKVLWDCHKVVQDFEHEGAPCVPTPGHKTGPSQVLNQLGHADIVVISLWEMVGVSFPGVSCDKAGSMPLDSVQSPNLPVAAGVPYR